ncbi:DUF4252 domain-containing protein [uncultured Bacteroides sp.]|uniref:DUF4252 domain-containing protein n=1 Tax=uncultured Bacteroides sp. TaxID=162156 RepID=UPI0025CE5E2B|nr:DUF4252 domain-containing protein [uncultured Bacteroides sp.]
MRTCKMILTGMLLLLSLFCQAQKNLFSKYDDLKGVTSVYISKAMIESNPNLFAKDVYIGKVSGQLNSVQVLSTMDNNVKKDLRKDLRSLVQSSKYELLMKQKGNVSSSEFYMNRKGDKVKELIMIIDGAATLKFVYLEGEMTLKDIQNIMMYQGNTGWNVVIPGLQVNKLDLADLNALPNGDWVEDLKGLSKLTDMESLKEYMDSDAWKRFEKQMEKLEERLENLNF